MDLVGRLRGIYERILGDSSSLRIVTTPAVPESDLLQRDVCTVQVGGRRVLGVQVIGRVMKSARDKGGREE